MNVNADLSQRAVVRSEELPWVDSPLPGVQRRLLERDGGEVARATSIVRYAPDSAFSAHTHDGGEEFLVLAGVFSDEHGDFGSGMYVRNPPGSRHTPRSAKGCTIFVKLRQMDPDDQAVVRIDTTQAPWQPAASGMQVLPLHRWGHERVRLVRLAAGARLERSAEPGGEEIFVVDGAFADELGHYPRGAWLRTPHGRAHAGVAEGGGCTLYVKTGHLAARDHAGPAG